MLPSGDYGAEQNLRAGNDSGAGPTGSLKHRIRKNKHRKWPVRRTRMVATCSINVAEVEFLTSSDALATLAVAQPDADISKLSSSLLNLEHFVREAGPCVLAWCRHFYKPGVGIMQKRPVRNCSCSFYEMFFFC